MTVSLFSLILNLTNSILFNMMLLNSGSSSFFFIFFTFLEIIKPTHFHLLYFQYSVMNFTFRIYYSFSLFNYFRSELIVVDGEWDDLPVNNRLIVV